MTPPPRAQPIHPHHSVPKINPKNKSLLLSPVFPLCPLCLCGESSPRAHENNRPRHLRRANASLHLPASPGDFRRRHRGSKHRGGPSPDIGWRHRLTKRAGARAQRDRANRFLMFPRLAGRPFLSEPDTRVKPHDRSQKSHHHTPRHAPQRREPRPHPSHPTSPRLPP